MKSRNYLLSALLCCLVLHIPSQGQALVAFGPPAVLNSTAFGDSDISPNEDTDETPTVAGDGAGTWVAAWASSNDLDGGLGSDFDILYTRSTDDGKTWTDAARLTASAASDGLASDSQVRVAKGMGDDWFAVWLSSNDMGGTIGPDNDLFFSRSTDNGVSWSAPEILNSDAADDGNAAQDEATVLATNGSGNWVVAWQKKILGGGEPTQTAYFYSTSTDDGLTWSVREELGAPSTFGFGLAQGIDVVYNGTFFVAAWGSTDDLGDTIGHDADILYSTITDGTFVASTELPLNSNAASDDETADDMWPSLASSGSDVVGVWQSDGDLGDTGDDFDIYVASSINGGTTWGNASALNSNATIDVGDDGRPMIGADSFGLFATVWSSDDELGGPLKRDVDLLMSTSTNNGAGWRDPYPAATTARKDKGDDLVPFLVNAGSSWMLVWESDDTLGKTIGGDDDIFYVRSIQDCPTTPDLDCFVSVSPGKSRLLMKASTRKNLISWKLSRGPLVTKDADLADPLSTADYTFCMYDQAADVDELIVEMDAPAGGDCYTRPCWRGLSNGYLYRHKFGVISGMRVLAGAEGRSRAQVKAGRGFVPPVLPLDQDSTVTVQLRNEGTGKCFGSSFSSSQLNSSELFRARSD